MACDGWMGPDVVRGLAELVRIAQTRSSQQHVAHRWTKKQTTIQMKRALKRAKRWLLLLSRRKTLGQERKQPSFADKRLGTTLESQSSCHGCEMNCIKASDFYFSDYIWIECGLHQRITTVRRLVSVTVGCVERLGQGINPIRRCREPLQYRDSTQMNTNIRHASRSKRYLLFL